MLHCDLYLASHEVEPMFRLRGKLGITRVCLGVVAPFIVAPFPSILAFVVELFILAGVGLSECSCVAVVCLVLSVILLVASRSQFPFMEDCGGTCFLCLYLLGCMLLVSQQPDVIYVSGL